MKWFKKAVEARLPNNLAGWKKTQSPKVRRSHALSSRPKSWSLDKKRRSVGRALQALANVTKDRTTKKVAKEDAEYFFKLLK